MQNTQILITGANSGIGLEFSRQILEKGATLYAIVRHLKSSDASQPSLERLLRDYPKTLHVFTGEITKAEDLKRLKTEVSQKTDHLDWVINNAGTYTDGDMNFRNLTREALTQSLAVNSIAPVMVAQAFLPLLEKSKQPKLANLSSLMGSIADNSSGGSYAYRMSKSALNMFVKSFSIDHPKITALTLHPGWVKTAMGGSSAPTSPEESVRGLLSVIEGAGTKQSGRFYDFEGDALEW